MIGVDITCLLLELCNVTFRKTCMIVIPFDLYNKNNFSVWSFHEYHNKKIYFSTICNVQMQIMEYT